MSMKRIEAPTLEEAYKQAAVELNCSITDINYEIIQHPSSGVMGLFKKSAIIIAVRKIVEDRGTIDTEVNTTNTMEVEDSVEVSNQNIKEESNFIDNNQKESFSIVLKDTKAIDNFFDNKKEAKEESFNDDRNDPQNIKLSKEIEAKLSHIIDVSCFDIDVVEVDVFNKIAHIFIDGEDAALLIGKEGYRYNALSYMLFNWINSKYDLYIKLEIAEFIQTQEDMIASYLIPIIEFININGRGKTKPLDGILVQIALEQLRREFPNKYVAIKTAKDGRKFVIVNDFNSPIPRHKLAK